MAAKCPRPRRPQAGARSATLRERRADGVVGSLGVGPVKMTSRARRRQRCPDHHVGTAGHEPDAEACAAWTPYFPFTKGLKLKYRWTNTKWIEAVDPGCDDRRGGQQLRPASRSSTSAGQHQSRGQLRLLDADRRRHQHLGLTKAATADQVPGSLARSRAGRHSAAISSPRST